MTKIAYIIHIINIIGGFIKFLNDWCIFSIYVIYQIYSYNKLFCIKSYINYCTSFITCRTNNQAILNYYCII